MATITEDYVSFETAKLLKEKGFDEPCWGYYVKQHIDHYFKPVTNSEWTSDKYSAPTKAVVMRWFRELYHIEIRATYDYEKSSWWGQTNPMYDETEENSDLFQKLLRFDYQAQTYEEACEAAIKYCLENLI